MVVTDDKKIKKMCVFYASDFHLEMIILPYLTEKIKENKKIKIITENSLKESMQILLSKINLKNKEDIVKIDWSNSNLCQLEDNTVLIINGTENFIKEKNTVLDENSQYIQIVNCFSFDEVKDKMEEIVKWHDKILNNLKK